MPATRGIKLNDGNTWRVVSDDFCDAGVLIPVNQLEGMSPAEIGRHVLELVDRANFVHAEEVADHLLSQIGYCPVKSSQASFDLIRPYKGQSQIIDLAITAWEKFAIFDTERERKRAGTRIAPTSLRRQIIERDSRSCRYCGDPISGSVYIDHVIPYSLGGRTEPDNLVCACFGCNSQKAGFTLDEAKMTLRDAATSSAAMGSDT